ncbi:Oidioi.mRNA.OKI2018_I69.chr1.g2256.t1.cds [Oikopleura dioica]|uniref:Oidioi.mRNA.OKI2018_I69.chr1.g2256.t1.cds n=1 Tax=Oikopleura dioica TaxID=34765 RepID=A0ABN7SQL1_OIKDI|nr:Oidioi.mRNA.OKI2018_I69.chr1.g2256.t1.cds [Oikopleura dioica]
MYDIPESLRDIYQDGFSDPHPGNWDSVNRNGETHKIQLPRGQLDPYADPGFSRAAAWAASNVGLLSNLGVIPISLSAFVVVNTDHLIEEVNAFWGFKPVRDPGLLYALASEFNLVSLEPKVPQNNDGVKSESSETGDTLTELNPFLIFIKKDASARQLRTALSNLVQFELGPDARTTLSDLELIYAAENIRRKFSNCQLFACLKEDPESIIRIKYTSEPVKGKKPSFIKRVRGASNGLGVKQEAFMEAWFSWLPRSRLGPRWSIHKMLMTSILTDSYWTYVTCKVLEATPDAMQRRTLRPDPNWWFERLVGYAAIDILAITDTVPNSSKDPIGFVEAIAANAAATERWVDKEDFEKAKEIRANLIFPTKDADENFEGVKMRLILNNAVACGLDRLNKYLEPTDYRLIPFGAACHPFWRMKLRAQLATKLAEKVVKTRNNEKVLCEKLMFRSRDWRQAKMEKQTNTSGKPFEFHYSLTTQDLADPVLSLFKEVLEGFKKVKLTAVAIKDWFDSIYQSAEETILSQRETFWERNPLMSGDWDTIRTSIPGNQIEIARFSYEQATRKNMSKDHSKLQLIPDPWFPLISEFALGNTDSDLAWQIPRDFWEVEAEGSRAWKARATRLVKSAAVGHFAVKACNKRPDAPISDPLHAVIEYAAQTAKQPAEGSLKETIEIVADNLFVACSETGEKPREIWRNLERMAKSYELKAVQQPNDLDPKKFGFLFMHRVPSAKKSKLLFQWIGNDADAAKESFLWEKDHPYNKKGSYMSIEKATSLLNDLSEFKPAEAAILVKLIAKARPKGHPLVLIATSMEAQQKWLDLVTNPQLKEETPSALWEENFGSLEFEELKGLNKYCPVLLLLVEEDQNRGLFRWQRLNFRETESGYRAIVWNYHQLVAPGKVKILRDLVSWGKGHLSNRHIRQSEKLREASLCEKFDRSDFKQCSLGFGRGVLARLACLTASLAPPTWLDLVSVSGLGYRPTKDRTQPFNTGHKTNFIR